MMPFERFSAWRLCHGLVLRTYQVTWGWPSEERFGLISQARRAASSAASNIAEGSAKRGRGEFARYLDISLGSLSELGYWFLLARDLKFLNTTDWQELDKQRDEAGKAKWGLYQRVLLC